MGNTELVDTDAVDRGRPSSISGEHGVLTSVYEHKAAVLRRLAATMTGGAGQADDVVQEAFICTMRARGAPTEPDELFFYLVRVVLNLTRSQAAKAARRASARVDDPGGRPAGAADPGGEPGRHPGPLAAAVAGLPRRQREVVFLRFWLDLSVEQTARTLDISTGSVKTHASRAMDRLRDLVEEDDHDR